MTPAPPPPPGPGNPAAFARRINQTILEPWFAAINGRLAQGATDYRAVIAAIQASPQDPNLRNMALSQASGYMKRVEQKHRHRFRRTMSAALGIPITPLTPSLGVADLMRRSIRDNADLIRTLPPRHKQLLTKRLLKLAATKPFDQSLLRQTVLQSRQSTYRQARLIARDQTSKLIGNLNQARQQQVGIEEYIWRSSQDEAVRPTHRANDGQTFSWGQPPPRTGHPGQDINCRCVAIPVFPQRYDRAAPQRRPLRRPAPIPTTAPTPPEYPPSLTLGGILPSVGIRPSPQRSLINLAMTRVLPRAERARAIGSDLDWKGWERNKDPRSDNDVFIVRAGADGPTYAITRPSPRTPAQWDRLDLDPEIDKWMVVRQGGGAPPRLFKTLAAARDYVLRQIPAGVDISGDADDWI